MGGVGIFNIGLVVPKLGLVVSPKRENESLLIGMLSSSSRYCVHYGVENLTDFVSVADGELLFGPMLWGFLGRALLVEPTLE